MKTTRLMVLVLSLLWPVAGNAQDRAFERWFVSVNAVSQASNRSTASDSLNHPPSDSAQRYGVNYAMPDGPVFDLGAGVRVGHNVSVGLAVSRFDAVVRHSIDSRDPSARRGTVVHLDHRQLGYHLQASWVVRVADRLDVAFFAGPSVFRVRRARVADVDIADGAGVPMSDFTWLPRVIGVTAQEVTDRLPGYSFGFDFTVRLTDRLGLGILARTTGSIAPSRHGRDRTLPVAGGSHVGIGARVRF